MEKSIIVEGKTSNEAIQKGLKELGCKLEDVDVKVLENEDKKVFFSILDPRVVRVQLKIKEKAEGARTRTFEYKEVSKEDVETCKDAVTNFLDKFCELYGDITYKIKVKDSSIYIEMFGASAPKLIGYRGENINALQTLISAISNNNTNNKVRVILDICDYKVKRNATLNELALKLEKTVTKTGKKIVLEPMSAYERKVLHLALQESKTVKTYSIGEEPRRKLVVEKK